MSLDSGFKEAVVVKGTEALSESFELIAGVQLDAIADPGNKGDTVNVTTYASRSASAVTAAMTSPTATAATQTSVAISLDYEEKSAIDYTGKEWATNQLSYSFAQQIKELVRANMFSVSAKLHALGYKIPYFAGVSGRSVFNNGTAASIDTLADVAKVLDDNRVGYNRKLIVSPLEAANYKKVTAVQNANQMGNDMVRRYGLLGMDGGFSIAMDQQVASVAAIGTITTGLITKAGTPQAVGTTSLVCTTAASTGACALLQGDIVTVDGKTYSLQANATQAAAATDVTLVLDRGLEIAVDGSEAVTLATNYGTGSRNIAGDLSGFGIFNRLDGQILEGKTFTQDPIVITHPSGLSMILGINPGYHKAQWECSILYGVNVIDSRKLVRVIGS